MKTRDYFGWHVIVNDPMYDKLLEKNKDITKSDQKITDQEQFLILEMLSTSQENTDKEMHAMRNNTVELNRAMKDIEEMKKTIEILKDKIRANGSH